MFVWIDLAALIFAPHAVSSHFAGPRLTSRDWQGIQPPVDSAMVGRVYFSPKPTSPPPQRRRQSSWKRKPRRKRPHRGRQSRHVLEDLLDFDWIDFDYFDTTYESIEQHNKSNPVQKVYFFKRGMNAWSHFYSATRMKKMYLLPLTPFWFVSLFSQWQISTTEWTCIQNVWTLSALLTHDPLPNTGWDANMRRDPIHQEQRRDRLTELIVWRKLKINK